MSQLLKARVNPKGQGKILFFDMVKFLNFFSSKKIILWKKMKHLLKYSGIFLFLKMESSKWDNYSTDPMILLFNYGIIFSLVIDTCPKLIICFGSQTIVFSVVLWFVRYLKLINISFQSPNIFIFNFVSNR